MVIRQSKYEALYQAIKEIKEEEKEAGREVSISLLCRLAGANRANYYKWLKHEISAVEEENEALAALVLEYHELRDHKLGYRQMRDTINRDLNRNYSDKRIYKIMHALGIQSRIRRKGNGCTVRKNNNTAPNLLNRDFYAEAPNLKWVGDVTEFKYGVHDEYKLFLSAFLDLHDRTLVGYEYSDRNDNALVFKSFEKAVESNPGATPLVHTDGGYQYTSEYFVNRLKELGMTQSMSRVHCCIDNGPMEGFWGLLKAEMYFDKHYDTKEELMKAIDEWIYYYMNVRYQRRFGVRTPQEVRDAALAAEKPAQYPIPVNRSIMKYKAEHYKTYEAQTTK